MRSQNRFSRRLHSAVRDSDKERTENLRLLCFLRSLIYTVLMQHQMGHLTLVVFSERDLRVHYFQKKDSFSLGKDFKPALAAHRRKVTVSLPANREYEARRQ